VQKLQSGLASEGFNLSVFPNKERALAQMARVVPDLVIIEVDEQSTPQILRDLEKNRIKGHIPVIALLSENTLSDADAIQSADDFISSPFNSWELVLRVKRLLKKTARGHSDEVIKAGNMTIDLANCEVSINGMPVELTFKEYELLTFLAKDRGRVFTREALLDRIWGYDYFGGDRTVDVHIRRLRSKIESYGDTYIETVRNIGYRFKKNLKT
jgi:DNA-binding response OmpR family regulator